EIQRAPELLLAIKSRVDRDPRPGQFLLTGSARVLAMRGVVDALPGRIETVNLWPFSQGEIDGTPDSFIDSVFAAGPEFTHRSDVSRDEYIARLLKGGFPGAQERSERRARAFFDSYVESMINREVMELSHIERSPQLLALLPMLAARSGSVLSAAGLANQLGLSRPTVARYLALLREVFLVDMLPALSGNISTRATAAPKIYFVDSGIAANLVGATEVSLNQPTGPLGPLLEGFVISELARQATWSQISPRLSHYRTKDGVEVDLVLEDRTGRVVAIEVKAASTVRSDDFRGLRHLRQRLGERFALGLVLHSGQSTLSFGPGLKSVPIAAIWEAPA
ncbi:MAG: ATP-binding protein, partial [Candidatus Nanopelagicales bacterium]|nr:ATP-binding protein [Candidatus Nanopelagicales bacterium]